LVLGGGRCPLVELFRPRDVPPSAGRILLDNPRWSAAILFYLVYALGVLVFPPALGLHNASLRVAILYGALFGFLAYMTYDLTNLATIKAWTLPLAPSPPALGLRQQKDLNIGEKFGATKARDVNFTP
jgi:hypothetical protein